MENTIPATTINLDLGGKKNAMYVLEAEGEIIDERIITNHHHSLRHLSVKYLGSRIAHEVGSRSHWNNGFPAEHRHKIIVASPSKTAGKDISHAL